MYNKQRLVKNKILPKNALKYLTRESKCIIILCVTSKN